MKIEIVRDLKEFKELEKDWKVLESQDKNTTFFQSFEYNYIWWKNFKKSKKYILNIIVVKEDNNRVIGIAPFIIETKKKFKINLKILKFMGWGDYLGILINFDNTNPQKIVSVIFDTVDNMSIDRVFFSNINIESFFGMYLKKHQKYGYKLEFQTEVPFVEFKKFKDFNIYKEQFLSTSVKKQKNKMSKELGYVLRVENKVNEIQFNKIEKIHKNLQEFLNKNKEIPNRVSIFTDDNRNRFLKELYANSKAVVNFLLTDQDDNVIIYDTCYFYKNHYYSWNMAHDIKYNEYNPGRVLNYEIIKSIFEAENKDNLIFDFGCGGYPWKFQWTSNFTSVYKLEYNVSNGFKMKLLQKLKMVKKGLECFYEILKS